ncbi:hypothetical protein TNCV_5139221 [Trichonephila clavipes]|nr:hypothetical protein TNCV_2167401 [Trichonephila clavipes]GFW61614.1 hypothetical protein TNCV_5139221 [Trichonephila clavipes]
MTSTTTSHSQPSSVSGTTRDLKYNTKNQIKVSYDRKKVKVWCTREEIWFQNTNAVSDQTFFMSRVWRV